MKQIDDRFTVSAQIAPDQVGQLASQGFTAILCARPDKEDADQPDFAEIAREADKHGVKAMHIPVSGSPTPAQVEEFRKQMSVVEGPVFGYCRSGARASTLYSAL